MKRFCARPFWGQCGICPTARRRAGISGAQNSSEFELRVIWRIPSKREVAKQERSFVPNTAPAPAGPHDSPSTVSKNRRTSLVDASFQERRRTRTAIAQRDRCPQTHTLFSIFFCFFSAALVERSSRFGGIMCTSCAISTWASRFHSFSFIHSFSIIFIFWGLQMFSSRHDSKQSTNQRRCLSSLVLSFTTRLDMFVHAFHTLYYVHFVS